MASRKLRSSVRSAPRADRGDPVARYAARLDRLLGQSDRGDAGALEASMQDERLVQVSSVVHRFAEDVWGQPRGDRQERMVLHGVLLPPLI